MKFCVIFFILSAILILPITAQPMPDSGDDIIIKLATYDPGDEFYLFWGHTSLVVEIMSTNQKFSFDFGVFSFEQENFIPNFIKGRLLYMAAGFPWDSVVYSYQASNRTIHLDTLNLSPDKRLEIFQALIDNIQPENSQYLYHHYKNNCTTIVRDIIDHTVGGQLTEAYKNSYNEPADTYRRLIRDYTSVSAGWDWLLQFLQGQVIDRPVSEWEVMFLPWELQRVIQDFRYTDENGELQNLVSEQEIVYQSKDRGPIQRPHTSVLWALIVGLLLAGITIFLRYMAVKQAKPGPSRAMVIWYGSWAVIAGLAGLLLLFLTFATDHDWARWNQNILLVNPLLLATLPGFRKFGQPGAQRITKRITLIRNTVAVLALLTLILKIIPGAYQANWTSICLLLPMNLAWVKVIKFKFWE